jgi:predicted RNA-binding protein with PIN domain
MSYLIDGYNVIGRGRDLGLSLAEEGKERRLLDLVARWRDRKGVRREVKVIFDGQVGVLAGGRAKFSHRGIGVEYAIGRSADAAIGEAVRRSAHPRALVVVTSDQAVQREARLHGAAVQSSDEFLALVSRALAPGEGEKPEGASSGEIDEWLRIFGAQEDDAP